MIVQRPSFGTGGEFQCSLDCTRLALGFGGREHSSNTMLRVDRELGGALQECCCCGNPAASLSSIGRSLQVICHLVVGMPRGLRQVPRATVRVECSISGLSEHPVRVASFINGCRLVDSRTDQRMPEDHLRRHFQQAVGLDLGSRGVVDSEVLGGAPHKSRIAGRLGSRDEEEAPGGR